jgi:hypothetical protein
VEAVVEVAVEAVVLNLTATQAHHRQEITH